MSDYEVARVRGWMRKVSDLLDRLVAAENREAALEAALRRLVGVEEGECCNSPSHCYAHDFDLPCPVADARRLLGEG